MILQEEPHITVGIQHGKSVDFRLCGIFTTPEGRLSSRRVSGGDFDREKRFCFGSGVL